METIPDITIDELMARYSVLLFDAYGVLVHSTGAIAGAAALVHALNRLGKPYYVLTNDASKLPTTAATRYQGYGLPLSPERMITSGALLEPYFATHHLVGARCIVLGPEDSAHYVKRAGGHVVSPEDAFDVVVIGDETGFPFLDRVDATLSALFHKLDRHESVHLILPNPDLIYPKGQDGFGMASGSVALMFEAALQLRYPERQDLRFIRLGKPHGTIFAEALRRSGTKDMVMIGDQLETDIRGANAFGLASVLVNTGVSVRAPTTLPEAVRPTYRLRALWPGGKAE